MKKQLENSSKENDSWTPLFLLKVFEMLEETTREHGANHPKVKESWALFKELAEPHLNLKGAPTLNSIKTDTSVTRQLLGFNPVPTIDYGFIKSENVRMQLHLDNLKMESVLSSPKESSSMLDDFRRFKQFCTYACYQVEELLNYLLFKSEEDYKQLLSWHLSSRNKEEFGDKASLDKEIEKRITQPSSIGFIDLSTKIYWFCWNLRQGDDYWLYQDTMTGIRKVRNDELHRFTVLEQNAAKVEEDYSTLIARMKQSSREGKQYVKTRKDKIIEADGKYARFAVGRDYNKVRSILIGLAEVVKQRLK